MKINQKSRYETKYGPSREQCKLLASAKMQNCAVRQWVGAMILHSARIEISRAPCVIANNSQSDWPLLAASSFLILD